MGTPIHIDLTPDMGAALEDHPNTFGFGTLDDLHRVRRRIQARTARRQTIAFGIVFGFIKRVVVIYGGRPRLERNPRLGGSSSTLTAASSAFTSAELTPTGGAGSSRRRRATSASPCAAASAACTASTTAAASR